MSGFFGSMLEKFSQSGAGAVSRSLISKLAERITAADFGAAGNGEGDDKTAIENAADMAMYPVEYRVTAYNNAFGADVTPDGVAHNATSGRVYNPRQQNSMLMFGQECLQHWFSRFAGASNINYGDNTIRTICLSGDSTTSGVGATYATPTQLLEDLAEQRGYSNVGVINRGQSGKATFDWLVDYLAGDLTSYGGAAPDLLVIRWGANDPYFGRSVEEFISDLRTGLTAIRAAHSVQNLSIVLMTPTSMNDVEKGRSQMWAERIGPAIRQAARDYQCAFIDSYAWLQNSHDAAGIWMDADASNSGVNPARAIHPTDVMYEHLMGRLADMIFPDYGLGWKTNAVRNTSSGDSLANKTGMELPANYYAGISMHRMADMSGSPDGGPYDGVSYTFKQADGAVMQISTPLPDGIRGSGVALRLGFSNSWSNWYGEQINGVDQLQNEWTNIGGIWKPFSYMLTLEGRVVLNGVISAGITADGSVVFTLPELYRPEKEELFLVLTENGVCRLKINVYGHAAIYGFGAGGGYISLGGLSFKAGLG